MPLGRAGLAGIGAVCHGTPIAGNYRSEPWGMPTAGMSGRKAERVGREAQWVPGGGGVMEIMGPTPGTLSSQCGSEGEGPVLGKGV